MRKLGLFLLCLIAFAIALTGLYYIGLNRVHSKGPIDFVQEYVMGKALLLGESPYKPIDELILRHIPEIDPKGAYSFPSPHPPLNSLVFAPLALLKYQDANIVWFAIQLLLLFFLVRVSINLANSTASITYQVILTVVLASLTPIRIELAEGQMNLLPALLFGLSVLFLKTLGDRTAGLLLSISLLLKPIMWPALVILAFRRRKAFIWCIVGCFISTMLVLCFLTPIEVWEYYSVHAVRPGAAFQRFFGNASLLTIGSRLFIGVEEIEGVRSLFAPPIIGHFPNGEYLGIILVICVLMLGFVSLRSVKSDEKALLLSSVLGVVTSPVSWPHYSTFIVPIVILVLFDAARTNTMAHRMILLVSLAGFMAADFPVVYLRGSSLSQVSGLAAFSGVIPSMIYLLFFIVCRSEYSHVNLKSLKV